MPILELKGFEIADLKRGESRTITFILTDKELVFFNNEGNYLVEPGIFKVFAGTSSVDLKQAEFELTEK